ncbi:MAG TPA: hypothetical protein VF718_12375 [Allosphingosinicella sp.]|jgi:lipopolysaccharide export LptBFGC system permease protein LptF
MRLVSSTLSAALGLAVVVVAADPAWAGLPVPGPAIGAGLPALALFGAGYWLIRRRRRG